MKMFTLSSRFLMSAGCALLFCGATAAVSWQTTAHAQNSTATAQKPKKKLPPGSHGFEQYAGRDASDKLVTGGATRDILPSDPFEAAMKSGMGAYGDGDYKQAVTSFQQAVKLKPNNFKANFSLGGGLENKGDLQKAPGVIPASR